MATLRTECPRARRPIVAAPRACPRRVALLSGVIAVVLATGTALADGILVPHPIMPPAPDEPRPWAFAIKYHHVDTAITGQVARTSVDQVFVNTTARRLEATYLFPIPDGAIIEDFNLWQDGRRVEGEVLEAAAARRIYEEIVRAQKDPGLLEYVDQRLVRVRVFPVPAGGETRVAIGYTELLSATSGALRYVYPLSTERFSARPIDDVRITVTMNADLGIKNLYCPSHDASIRRPDDYHATVSYEEAGTLPDEDFVLYYTLADDPIGMSLLTYQPKDGDGYFLLLASPPVSAPDERVAAKDVVFVFDRTGSMKGEKIDQARQALKYALQSLNSGDRFELVPFNESPDPLFGQLVAADDQNLGRALAAIDALTAEGGTDIDDALREAFALLGDAKRPGYAVFLTDGLPTVGERDVGAILNGAAKTAPRRTRLFVFGVGYDVNTTLLDGLATDIRGTAQYVRPGEDLEVPLSDLARRISYPVLTDIDLDFAGIEAYDIYPRRPGDIFRGTQLLVSGRYRGGDRAAVTLTGRLGDAERSFDLRQDLRRSGHEEFVALIWASRKIGFLVDEIRRHGRTQELVDEIVRLGTEYGIITEYTSFLVREPDIVQRADRVEEARQKFYDYNAKAFDSESGGWAVNQSINAQNRKQSGRPVPLDEQMFYDADGRAVTLEGVTNVGRRIFFRRDGAWIENTYVEDQKVLEIERFSPAQFQLLERDPSLGRLMALGERVLFMVNGQAVRIGDAGASELTDAQLRSLIGS